MRDPKGHHRDACRRSREAPHSLELRDLHASRPADIELLHEFYGGMYLTEFPDPDERESLENIRRYLERRDQGWYGENGYHVVIALLEGEVVGGAIVDYLAAPATGVIEFLVVDPSSRGAGLGSHLLQRTEELLEEDATRSGGRLVRVVAEVDDPYRADLSGFDPFLRTAVWSRWGFRLVDFPYVQPALSPEQEPAVGLLLITRHRAGEPDFLPSADLISIVGEYMRWAMRIPDPTVNAEFRSMRDAASTKERVALRPLDAYIGRPADRPLHVREITGPDDPMLAAVIHVYEEVFTDPATAIPGDAFRDAVGPAGLAGVPGLHYHLWALSESELGRVLGMASFLTMPSAGFGGYACLTGPLRGTGRVRSLLARVEERIRRDSPDTRGWYIECAGLLERDIFVRTGFVELAVPYRQPAETGLTECSLHLLYKPYGRVQERPHLPPENLLNAVADIYRWVYSVADPRSAPGFQTVARAVVGLTSVPLCPARPGGTP